jgi:hypothetical protein
LVVGYPEDGGDRDERHDAEQSPQPARHGVPFASLGTVSNDAPCSYECRIYWPSGRAITVSVMRNTDSCLQVMISLTVGNSTYCRVSIITHTLFGGDSGSFCLRCIP